MADRVPEAAKRSLSQSGPCQEVLPTQTVELGVGPLAKEEHVATQPHPCAEDEQLEIDRLASCLPCLEATLLRKLHRPRSEMALVDLRAVEVAGQSRDSPKSITYVERHGNPYDLDVSH